VCVCSPTPSEALYGAGSAEDLARSYGGGDLLTSANLVTSAAQAAAAHRGEAGAAGGGASGAHRASADRASPDRATAGQGSRLAPVATSIPQRFVHAPARSSASIGSSVTSPSSLAKVIPPCSVVQAILSCINQTCKLPSRPLLQRLVCRTAGGEGGATPATKFCQFPAGWHQHEREQHERQPAGRKHTVLCCMQTTGRMTRGGRPARPLVREAFSMRHQG
jgi:hypothetical protein